jgi:hypothetical protein
VFVGIGTLVYYSFPQLAWIKFYLFISLFGLVGTALQQVIQKAITSILGPLGRLIAFYEKLMELAILAHHGVIPEKKQRELVEKLCEQRFLNPKQLSE